MWLETMFFYGCCFYFGLASVKERKTICDEVDVVPRLDWRARDPIRSQTMKMPVSKVIIMHTVSPPCRTKPQCIRNVQFIQDYHLDCKGWSDIAYNFLIGGDGRVYEGLGWTETGAHSINFNTDSIGVAFIGDYSNVAPANKMLDAALKLIDCGVKEGYLTPTREIHGHKDVACTASPGDKLYTIIRKWTNYKGGRMPLYHCKQQKVNRDGDSC